MATLTIRVPLPPARREKLYKWASGLALITIIYNIVEGLVSVGFGLEDETVALMGFGLDSFVEVISGVGIYHMVRRIRQGGSEDVDRFEITALRITGTAFYLLTGSLVLTAGFNLYAGHAPETTFWGIVVGGVSIATMWALIYFKLKVGRELGSDAIIADANCTKACLYLSVVLLVASLGYELTGIGGIDSAGALVIAWLSFREGRESFEKAEGKKCSCAEGSCGPT